MTKIILLFFSIAYLVAGIIIISLVGQLSLIVVVFLIAGFTLLIISFLFRSSAQQYWHKRSTKQSINALSTTIIVLIILGIINTLAIRYNMRWDLTENQLHTLSSYSKTIIGKLEQPLQVSIFDRSINSNLENLLQNYHRQSQQFRFRLINPEQELGLAKQYGVESLGEIYLDYGNKRQKLNQSTTAISQLVDESQLTNAIEAIKRDRTINIYLLQGHGEATTELVERGLAQAIANLTAKGYAVQELNLATQNQIPDNADLIAIAGATRKLLTAEVSGLQNYLLNGGSLLLLLSPNTDIGITPLLQNWGIELDNRLIVDGSDAGNIMGFGPGVIIVNDYGNHPITTNFRHGTSIFPESRPLKVEAKKGIKATSLAISNQKTWAESNLKNEEITFDINYDLSGPLNIAIALEKQQSSLSRIVVFGSSTFVANGWFEQQLNGDLFLNSITWLTGEDRTILSLRPRFTVNRRINLSSLQSQIISSLALCIMPLIAFTVGILYSHQRR